MEDAEKSRKKLNLHKNRNREEEEDEEIELSLGLSMNGRFGVDPMRKRLKRSSTISNSVSTDVEDGSTCQARGMQFDGYAPTARTRSLPTEAEEEWRRRKEFQSMRRMEARKKRLEKLKNVGVVKDKENCCEVVNGSGGGQRGVENGIIGKFEDGNEISESQGSIGSRTGSSGVSDLESHQIEGAKQNAEVITTSCQHSQDQAEPEPEPEATNKDGAWANKLLKNAMFDMPYVTTKVDGPKGRKTEGFLYRYKRGEQVKIVCVCHGMFLTPAEFVKHAGGGDVDNPLKHIVVNPFPLM